MKHLSKKLSVVLLCVLTISFLLPTAVSADMGPKASVNITFENMGDEPCYGTLLSKAQSTGPYSVWNGESDGIYYYEHNGENVNETGDLDIWRAFAEYEDTDGYYFLQVTWKVSEEKKLVWGYYPPSSFKILLYYPETGRFTVSQICERYAFDTYYTVDMADGNIDSAEYDDSLSSDERIDSYIKAYRSYQFKQELISLVARIVITVIIETFVAFLFGFTRGSAVLYLALINTVTQVILNVLLNVINFNSGEMAFVFWYILLEIVVFAIEAAAYIALRGKLTEKEKPKYFYVLYSFIANAVSFASGLIAANIFPGIF